MNWHISWPKWIIGKRKVWSLSKIKYDLKSKVNDNFLSITKHLQRHLISLENQSVRERDSSNQILKNSILRKSYIF